MNRSNYLFTKKLYLELILDCKNKNDQKNLELLENGWQEIEKMYEEVPCGEKGIDTAT